MVYVLPPWHPKEPEKVHHDYFNLAIVTSLPPYIKGPKKDIITTLKCSCGDSTSVSSKFNPMHPIEPVWTWKMPISS